MHVNHCVNANEGGRKIRCVSQPGADTEIDTHTQTRTHTRRHRHRHTIRHRDTHTDHPPQATHLPALDRVCLPRARLPVCNDGPVVSLQHRQHHWFDGAVIQRLLRRRWRVDAVKVEAVCLAQPNIGWPVNQHSLLRWRCVRICVFVGWGGGEREWEAHVRSSNSRRETREGAGVQMPRDVRSFVRNIVL